MNFASSLNSALRAIMANKLRSALTMLGVVIGVGSVIAMIGIGEGTKRKSLEQLEIMGSNRITVMPDWGRGRQAADGQSALRLADVERIRDRVPGVKYVLGVTSSRGQTVKFGANNHRTMITGAEPELSVVMNATKMLDGEWYTHEDELMQNRVAVLGYEVYDRLYGGERAVGTSIRVRDQNFLVVGVVDYKGGSGMMNPDDQVYIPFQTALTVSSAPKMSSTTSPSRQSVANSSKSPKRTFSTSSTKPAAPPPGKASSAS